MEQNNAFSFTIIDKYNNALIYHRAVKDVVTDYWFNYKMATIEFGDEPQNEKDHALKSKFAIVLKSKFAIVTIHDACPIFF